MVLQLGIQFAGGGRESLTDDSMKTAARASARDDVDMDGVVIAPMPVPVGHVDGDVATLDLIAEALESSGACAQRAEGGEGGGPARSDRAMELASSASSPLISVTSRVVLRSVGERLSV
jgi:hypothetical protein